MDQKKTTYYTQTHFWVVGLLTGLFTGLLSFVLYFAFNLFADRSFSLLFIFIYLFPAIGMYYAVIRLRNRYGRGVIQFRQAFSQAILAGFTASIVIGVLVYFVYTYMNPQSLQGRMSHLESSILQDGVYAAKDIRDVRSLIQKLLSPFLMSLSIFAINFILSMLYAFIIAIFARRKDRYMNL